MKVLSRFLTVILLVPVIGFSQQNDTLVTTADSVSLQTDSLTNRKGDAQNAPVYDGAKIDFKTYFTLLGDDIKQQATWPFHAKGKDWVKAGGFTLLTAAVGLTDKPVNRFAVKLHDNNPALASISKYTTNFGGAYELYAIAGLYTYGLVFKNQKLKTTTLLATQGYIISVGITTIVKYLAAEQRPYYTDPLTDKKGPIFHGPFYPFKKGPDGKKLSREDYSSFPSGHATAAFAAATVFAMEYRDKPLIPILSYSAATLVSLSRLTENKHWAADIAAGGLIGYFSSTQAVNNFHRYLKIKQAGKSTHQAVSFNFQYLNKQIVPGLVYNF